MLEELLILGPVPVVFHQAVFDNGTELVGESLMVPWTGLVTNSILFWWLFAIKDKRVISEVLSKHTIKVYISCFGRCP